MKRMTWIPITVCLVALLAVPLLHAAGRGGGGRGSGGGGARVSAARSASSRSMPANYGSMRSDRPRQTQHVDHNFDRPVDTSFDRSINQRPDVDQYRGETRTIETKRGGDVTIGVSEGGDVGIRGETAGGRDYAGVRSEHGDAVMAGENKHGEVVARARGDGDGVVEVLPDGYRSIYYGDDLYYYHNHHYYWPYYYGGAVYYQEIYPPDGVTIEDLPSDDVETVVINGVTYYVYDGVYYELVNGEYVVRANPTTVAATAVTPAPAAPALKAADLVRAMCAHVGTYTNFLVDCTEQIEKQGSTPNTIKRRIVVGRPNCAAAAGRDGSVVTRFWYDGSAVTVLDHDKKVYSTIDAPSTVEAMIDMLQDEYGMSVPMIELFSPGFCDMLGANLEKMTYAGEDRVNGVACRKLTLMTDTLYAQLWIDADDKAPLPRKVDILYLSEGRKPRYVGTITAWEARGDEDPALFTALIPDDARKIDMLRRVE